MVGLTPVGEFEIVVTRRPPPEAPATFVCCACQRPVQVGQRHHSWRARGYERQRPPVCASCVSHWSTRVAWRGLTRGDRTTLMRLKAMTSLLSWEVMNGRRR